MEFFRPYEGDHPYIFVSYAHANSPQVMEVITHMHSRGYRIWYDEGIEVGSEWPECIASHLAGAHLMLAFISNAYMASDNCRREMHFAISRKIKIINIFLEDTRMTPGMEMQIGNIFALMKQNMSDQVFFQKLYAAPLLNSEAFATVPGEAVPPPTAAAVPEKKKEKREKPPKPPRRPREKRPRPLWRRILALCLLVTLLGGLITLGIVGYSTGLAQRLRIRLELSQPETLSGGVEAVFESPLLEAAARDYCGIAEGPLYVSDLAGLRELYIVGDAYFFTAPEVPAALVGEPGPIRSLTDLRYFVGLDKLSLIRQQLSSLETIPPCAIEYLDLSGCRITSLRGVGSLTGLRQLTAKDCPLRDLGDIDHCLKLSSLDLSGSSLSDFSPLKPLTKLSSFAVSNCALDEMSTALHMSSLTDVTLQNCDLRGNFFKRFDRERRIVSLSLDHCQLNATVNLEDFTGLTTLTLLSTGEELDWSLLSELPVLSKVYYDAPMAQALERALGSSGVQLILVEEGAA